jgi:hypothetical protein
MLEHQQDLTHYFNCIDLFQMVKQQLLFFPQPTLSLPKVLDYSHVISESLVLPIPVVSAFSQQTTMLLLTFFIFILITTFMTTCKLVRTIPQHHTHTHNLVDV